MERCIELAKKGAGYVSPNPLVGCVIVKNGKIVAEGYHKKFGQPHAEVNAIRNTNRRRINLEGGELYVNLEPCYHCGKTPPCVNEIIRNKFKRVVIGIRDPNPLVNGKSIKKIKRHKYRVTEGVLKSECEDLNKFFLKYIRTGLPYITLKAAVTLDGKIADEKHRSKWVSSYQSRKLVHKLRSEYDAVLVGRNTVEYDNPSLTVRHVKGRNPYRIIIDKNLKLDLKKKIFSEESTNKTIVLISSNSKPKRIKDLKKRGITLIDCKTKNGKLYLKDALKKLGKIGMSSVLVEGGAVTYSEFLKQKLVDELIMFIAPKKMGKGIDAFKEKDLHFNKLKHITVKDVGRDVMIKIKLDSHFRGNG